LGEVRYADGNEIDLFIDIHNHTQFHRYNAFIFQDHSLDNFGKVLDKYWPIRIHHSTFKGSSCAWLFGKGIPSGTIELSQSYLNPILKMEIILLLTIIFPLGKEPLLD